MSAFKEKQGRIKQTPTRVFQSIAEQMSAAVNHPRSRVAEVFRAIDDLTNRSEVIIPLHESRLPGYPDTLPAAILNNARIYRETH